MNVFLRFWDVSSLILNLSVRFFNPTENRISVSTVIGGINSFKAYLNGSITFFNASKVFLNASMTAFCPPYSFHVLRRVFLAFDVRSINPPTTLLKPVQSFLLSSKSPKTISHVLAQPEPAASLSVSRS